MDPKLPRVFFLELIGAFGLVLFSAGLVCINQTTTPAGDTATSPLTLHQPGVFGVALGQGLILAALLALTAPATGGYLNPAIAVTLWVMGRIESRRAAVLIGARFLGGILAALCLKFIFAEEILKLAQFGAPHINTRAYPPPIDQMTLVTCALIELLLTFFLVFAIFGLANSGDALKLGLVAGMIATACALFGFPLTGAALNPARWLGPALLDAITSNRNPWTDALIYLAGPILGSLAGGFFAFKLFPTQETK